MIWCDFLGGLPLTNHDVSSRCFNVSLGMLFHEVAVHCSNVVTTMNKPIQCKIETKNKNDNKMDGMYTEACNKRRSGPWYKPNYRGPACNQKSANWNVLDLAVTRVSALQKELGAMIFFCTLTSWKNVSKKSWLSAKKNNHGKFTNTVYKYIRISMYVKIIY